MADARGETTYPLRMPTESGNIFAESEERVYEDQDEPEVDEDDTAPPKHWACALDVARGVATQATHSVRACACARVRVRARGESKSPLTFVR